jgi:uncharacterized protein
MSQTVSISEPVVAICINEQYPHVRNAEDLQNSTLGLWRMSRDRAEKAEFVFAVYQGVIREVYEVSGVQMADRQSIQYWVDKLRSQGRHLNPAKVEKRYGFTGKVAPEYMPRKYVGNLMPVRHRQNPVRYFNC